MMRGRTGGTKTFFGKWFGGWGVFSILLGDVDFFSCLWRMCGGCGLWVMLVRCDRCKG